MAMTISMTHHRLVLFCVILIQCWKKTNSYLPSYNIPYCSHDSIDPFARAIPPLSSTQHARVRALEQVQVVARHGARSPALRECKCWEGYEPWNNCTVSELMIETVSKTATVPWYYRKVYDGSPNYLHGDCMSGQLILEGYQQELRNGQLLRKAYLEGDLRLFDTRNWSVVEPEVYIRSDDEQRTLMSGQLIINEMFQFQPGAIINVHTGDFELDQMDPNKLVCPRLDQVRREAFETSEFKAWLQTERVVGISNILNDIFGSEYWSWGCIMDCTMTSACTNRPIPDGNGWVHMSDDILKEVTRQTESYWRHLFEYNQTEFSTLSMGNLAWQLRSHIESKLGILLADSKRPPMTDGHKFHLFAAHDFTLLPLLTKMAPYAWDHTWPPYASMLSIELYSAQPSEQTKYGYLFRVVYNSNAFVLEGCNDSLCDVEILLNILSFGKEVMPCGLHASKTDQNEKHVKDDDESECYMNQADFSGYMALAIVLTGVISAGLTIAVYTFIFGVSCKRFGYSTVNRELELDTVTTNSMHASA